MPRYASIISQKLDFECPYHWSRTATSSGAPSSAFDGRAISAVCASFYQDAVLVDGHIKMLVGAVYPAALLDVRRPGYWLGVIPARLPAAKQRRADLLY